MNQIKATAFKPNQMDYSFEKNSISQCEKKCLAFRGAVQVINIVHTLEEYKANVTVYDPWANPKVAKHEYGIDLLNELPNQKFDAVVLAVAHDQFKEINFDTIVNGHSVVYDVKGIIAKNKFDMRL